MKKHFRFLLVLAVFSFMSQSIFATDGYFRHGFGIKYSALAGAGSALSLSSIGAATNPASLASLGNRFDVDFAVFSPARQFTVTGNPSGYPGTFGLMPGTTESESNYFYMPTLGVNYKVQDNMALGLMFYGNGGMNSDYPKQIFGDPSSPGTGVNIEQMFIGLTFAAKVDANQSLGITGLFGYQRFAAKGLAAFSMFSSDSKSLTGNRVSTSSGFGVRVGYQGTYADHFMIGASYQTKMSMSAFDGYKGLFAEKGDFDVPANWVVGIATDVIKDFTFAFDVRQILYSAVRSINNPMIPNIMTAPLGADNGAGFGWKNMTIYKFGVMYKGIQDWTFMGGFSYGKEPISETEVMFNILAPGVIESHLTFGVSKMITKTNELNVAFMYALPKEVAGANPLEAPGLQTIVLKMSQWQLEFGYAFSF
ncbi:MAG: outer membrane protein transport protein [Ignavibacteriales bacterium]|nr:outer membrane protein transport protein [Ignavibacteriales bacterium]